MTILGNNIKFLRKKKNLTQEQLAKKTGVKRPLIGAYEEGRVEPKLATLLQLSTVFEIGLDDLIRKTLNENSLQNASSVDVSGRQLRVLPITLDKAGKEVGSLVSAKASAGYTNGYGDVDFIEHLPTFSMPFQEIDQNKTIRVFQIQGDSMLPVLPGSYIICEYVQDWQDIQNDGCYVLATQEEGIVFKRVLNNLRNGFLRLKSDNTVYEAYDVSVTEIAEVWKAVGFVSFELPKADSGELLNSKNLSDAFKEIKKDLEEIKGRV